ncbi:MAG: hypothetical protein RLO18_27805, partial [Gimesia chilikensis]
MISRFSALLLFVPALGMLSLSVTEVQAEQAALRAGAAMIDITPEPGVSLDGVISKNGPVTGVHDRIYSRAL